MLVGRQVTMNQKRSVFSLLFYFRVAICQASDWRYESHDGSFTNGDEVHLQYIGAGSFIKWEIDSSACEVQNPTNPDALLHCSLPGIYAVKAKTVGLSSSKYIKFDEKIGCYSWYISSEFVQYIDGGRSANAQHSSLHVNERMKPSYYAAKASVWILDAEHGDDSESNCTATQPSPLSTALTKQFHRLGQEPVLSFLSGGLHSHYSHSDLQGFDLERGTWNYTLYIETFHEPHYMISGHLISLYGCTVRNTHVFLPRPTFDSALSQTGVKLVGSVTMNYPEIIQDPCMKNAAVLLSRDGLYLTEDGFITSELLKIFLFSTILSEIEVKNAAFTSSYLVLHVDNNFYAVDRKTGTASVVAGFDASSVLGIKNQDWCNEGVHAAIQNDNILVHTTSEIMIAESVISVFSTKAPDAGLFPDIASPIIRITDASLSPSPGSVGVAGIVTGGAQDMAAVMMYHVYSDSWLLLASWEISDISKNYSLTFQNSGSTRFIVWTSDEVFMANVTDLIPVISNGGGAFTIGGEEIKQVIMSTDGRMVFGLSSGIFGFGRTTNNKVVRLSSGSHSATSLCVWFDGNDDLYILELDVNGMPERRTYPLDSGLVAALYPDTQCPYSSLESSVHVDEHHVCHHLDQGETYEMWVSLVYPTSLHTGEDLLEVEIEGADNLLTVNITTNTTTSGDLILENKTIVFKQEHANSFALNAITTGFNDEAGLVGLEARPSASHIFCETSSIMSHIFVGCFHSRHIRVQSSSSSCDAFSNYSYTILKEQIEDFSGTEPSADKVVEYDFDRLGCPIRVNYQTVYTPEILLYSDDQILSSVDVNFVLWEENGRKLAYNSTMHEVGCRRKSQTWQELMTGIPPESTVSTVWGPENFESCFTNDLPVTDEVLDELKSLSYQVMNKTGHSGLVFSEKWDGLYILNVKIVDPKYSYCDYQTRFAIEVYGVVKEELSQALIITLTVFISIIIVLLLFSYFYFKIHIYNRDTDHGESGEDDLQNEEDALPVIQMSYDS